MLRTRTGGAARLGGRTLSTLSPGVFPLESAQAGFERAGPSMRGSSKVRAPRGGPRARVQAGRAP
jgi:hypothetical protein